MYHYPPGPPLATPKPARLLLVIFRVAVDAYPVEGQLGLVRIRVQDLPAHVAVDLPDDDLESRLHVRGVQSRRLHEEQAFGFGQRLAFLDGHFTDVIKIALVAYQHLGYGGVRMCCVSFQRWVSYSRKKIRKQNVLSIGSSEDSTAVYIQMKI